MCGVSHSLEVELQLLSLVEVRTLAEPLQNESFFSSCEAILLLIPLFALGFYPGGFFSVPLKYLDTF